jgi:hypothetical protein
MASLLMSIAAGSSTAILVTIGMAGTALVAEWAVVLGEVSFANFMVLLMVELPTSASTELVFSVVVFADIEPASVWALCRGTTGTV